MSEDLGPQAYLDSIAQKLGAESHGPRRHYTQAQIDEVVMGIPLLARIVLLEVRDGRTYWQIAWRYWITPRRVRKEYARALVGLLRGFRKIDGLE